MDVVPRHQCMDWKTNGCIGRGGAGGCPHVKPNKNTPVLRCRNCQKTACKECAGKIYNNAAAGPLRADGTIMVVPNNQLRRARK